MDNEPWLLLDPHDLTWCRTTEIIDYEKAEINRQLQDSLAYIIIQDTNMIGGIFWYVNAWYMDDPNRYAFLYFRNNWPFNKELIEMNHDDIVFLADFPNIKYKVNNSYFGLPDQQNFCKILTKINIL